ncbi:MAG: phosphatidylglycerol lysyltransferase domain-containing protein [Bacteroidota bacterium]
MIEDKPVLKGKEIPLTVSEYVSRLRSLTAIPTSNFLLSTIQFWNDEQTVKFYAIEEALLLVHLKPPFGCPFAYVLCTEITDELINCCMAIIQPLGVFKLRVTEATNSLSNYVLQAELDENEYVYQLKDLAELAGSKYKKQRNALKKVVKENEAIQFNVYELKDYTEIEALTTFCKECIEAKSDKSDSNTVNLNKEWLAFNKCIALRKEHPLKLAVVTIAGKLSGLLIFEELNKDWIVGHFFKTINGLGVYLLNAFSTFMLSQNYSYFNFQEDRGVESLRYFKQQLNPISYLKSYQVISK